MQKISKTWDVKFIVPEAEWSEFYRKIIGHIGQSSGAPLPGDLFVKGLEAAMGWLVGGIMVPGKVTVSNSGLSFKPHFLANIAIKNPQPIIIPATDLVAAWFTGSFWIKMVSPRPSMAHIKTTLGEVRIASQFQSKQIADTVGEVIRLSRKG